MSSLLFLSDRTDQELLAPVSRLPTPPAPSSPAPWLQHDAQLLPRGREPSHELDASPRPDVERSLGPRPEDAERFIPRQLPVRVDKAARVIGRSRVDPHGDGGGVGEEAFALDDVLVFRQDDAGRQVAGGDNGAGDVGERDDIGARGRGDLEGRDPRRRVGDALGEAEGEPAVHKRLDLHFPSSVRAADGDQVPRELEASQEICLPHDVERLDDVGEVAGGQDSPCSVRQTDDVATRRLLNPQGDASSPLGGSWEAEGGRARQHCVDLKQAGRSWLAEDDVRVGEGRALVEARLPGEGGGLEHVEHVACGQDGAADVRDGQEPVLRRALDAK
eukprot:758786-Hanusia_phi.AAC.3